MSRSVFASGRGACSILLVRVSCSGFLFVSEAFGVIEFGITVIGIYSRSSGFTGGSSALGLGA